MIYYNHYFDSNVYTGGATFTATDETLDWMIAARGTTWSRLRYVAITRFYDEPDYWPPKPPVIDVISQSTINMHHCMPNGVLADYFSLGSFWFVSPRLKVLFESFSVPAFYSEANVTIKGQLYPEQYWLFVPSLALDAIDRESSEYEEDLEYVESNRIQKIKKLVLAPDKIPNDTPLFELAATVKNIRIMHDDLVEALREMGVTGMDILPILEGEWMY